MRTASAWMLTWLFCLPLGKATQPPDGIPPVLPGSGLSASPPEAGPFVQVDGQFMVPYQLTVPGSSVSIEMIPVPGGEFVMGSEAESEGPPIRVRVEPMWVAKTETTWREYELYMSMYKLFNALAQRGERKVSPDNESMP